MTGTGPGGRVEYAPLLLQGCYDLVFSNGAYNPNCVLNPQSLTFGQALKTFLDFLVNNSFGFTGLASAEIAKQTQISNPVVAQNGKLQFSYQNGNLTSNEYYRFSRTGVPGFSGNFRVTNCTANSFQLANPKFALYKTLPTQGTIVRTQLFDGTRIADFYDYTGYSSNINVRKKNPGRVFSPTRSRPKRKVLFV